MNKTISNLVGGVNSKTSPLIIKDSECELILNYHLDLLGALTKRAGYTTYASQPVAGKTIVGLFQYINTATTAETTQIMVANAAADANTVVYYNNGGTWTASLNDTAITTFTNFNRYRFATFLDKVMRVNGTAVVSGSVNVNGATWTTSATPDTGLPATITPSFIANFQDRVYVARSGVGDASRVYFSSLPSTGATPAITWTIASDYFDVNPDDGDEITALENNGNRLLMFKNRAMYRWTYGQVEPDRLIGVGTSSQESVKTNFDLGITFFANQRGIYAYNPLASSRPKLISRKIQKYVDAVSDWTNVFGEVDQDHYYLAVGNLTVDGRTFSNSMFVYHISLDAWTIYTLATPVKFMARLMPTSPVENIYFGDNTGRTYLFLTGAIDNATDISGEILTKEYTLSFPEITTLNDIYVFAQQRINAQVKYQLDRKGNFNSTGDLTERFTKFGVGEECRTVRLRITDNSSATSIIEGFNFSHTQKNKTE